MAAADSTPVPVIPAPASESARGQLLASLPLTTQFQTLRPSALAEYDFFPALPVPASVPLFVWHCSYLI